MTDRIEAEGIVAEVDRGCGFLWSVVRDGGRAIDVMHRAPWQEDAPGLETAAAHLRRLRGDFFCLPFADASADAAPLHGWTANAGWSFSGQARAGDRVTGRWLLDRPACGAEVEKQVTLIDGSPFLHQRHVIRGGAGRWAVANHAMIRAGDAATIRTSPRQLWATPRDPQESDPARGRSHLAYPAQSADPRRFPAAAGGTVDLLDYPLSTAHEDFVMALEAGPGPGWVAVTLPGDGALFLSLRDAAVLPLSMFWHSNGGRHYGPWASRHKGVLGIEEGAGFDDPAMMTDGVRAEMARCGLATGLALTPGGVVEVCHVTGQIDWPSGEAVA
ncbi:MAG: hypothetical protein RLZZ528_581, partial [Pseudomonadota bacterium]